MSSPGNPATRSFSGRRLSRTKSKKRHFVHQNVAVFRASDPVMSVFMWGVSHTITDLAQVLMPVMLLPDDFKSSSKMKVSNHFFNKENLPGHFKFKEYCPLVFRNLRERFGVEDQEYQVSLTRRALLKDSSSREARLFALSHDRTLVIKQICSEEVEGLHGILSEYHQHVVTCHGVTLLPHFLGMYRISVEGEDSYLLVSRNMFSHRLSIHLKYELKGSLVSREASDKEKEKDLPTFKDMDFRNNTQRVYISEDEKEKFLDTLNRDVEFLMRLKIMDYSVLLGIHDISRAEHGEEDELKDSSCEEEDDLEADASCFAGTSPHGITGFMNSGKFLGPGEFNPYIDVYAIKSVEGDPHREIYFMGIIDILTQYDSRKKAAHAAKTVKHGAGAEISTVNPEQYARRFRDFISNIFAY